MEDMTRPLLDKLVANNDEIERLFEQIKEKDGRIQQLETVVFERDQPLDIFERIHVRIAEGTAATKSLENRLDEEVKILRTRMEEVDQNYGI